jgi:hypothetical protein
MNRKDWRTVKIADVDFDVLEIENQLIPVLRSSQRAFKLTPKEWAERLVDDCRQKLSIILPLRANELAFLDSILEQGEIKAELLTSDKEFIERVNQHPLLQWKAMNVRQHKGK